MKRCTRCEVVKPLNEFGNLASAKDGLRLNCKKCYNTTAQRYYERNKEKVKARSSAYFKANREEQNAKRRQRRLDNLDHEKQTGKKWALSNPEKTRAYKSANRARRIAQKATGSVATKDIAKILSSKWCFYCYKVAKLTLDHVIPLSRGGAHSLGNLVGACKSCNSSKGAKTIMEWRKSRAPF